MRARGVLFGFCSAAALGIAGQTLHATPYASGVQKTGTSVSFILNEPADTLTYSINGGAPVSLDGTTKGTKTFTLGSATDKFSIVAEKNAATGFLIPTGGTLTAVPSSGVRIDSPQSGTNLISDDGSILSRYFSPRGVDVNQNPNSPYFGTAFIVNSASGTNTGGNVIGPDSTPATQNVGRTTGDGLYALKADESDAFGNGDTAVNPLNIDSFPAFSTASASSGYRISIGDNDKLFVTDYSDVNGQLFQVDPNISIASGAGVNPTAINILSGFGGPAPVGTTADGTGLPAGQNHGSISAVYTTGSLANGNLVVYGIDEDLNSAHVGTSATQNDRNSLWQWNVGSGGDANGANYSAMPTQLTPGTSTNPAPGFPNYVPGLIGDFPTGGIIVDMTRGSDGKFYLAENRSAGQQDGLIVTDPTGAMIWDSLAASRTLVGDPNAADILTGVGGIDVSPDGKYLAIIQIDNDITILPLVNGVPDLANRLVMDGGTNTANGRDIAFDAAGNLYMLTSGQAMYRAYSPGGHTKTTLSFDGSSYSFVPQTIAAGLGGDFNHDNKVDGADFLVWQNTLGDAASLATWKANFGMSSAAAAASAVPEPASLGMLAFAGVLGLAARKRRSA